MPRLLRLVSLLALTCVLAVGCGSSDSGESVVEVGLIASAVDETAAATTSRFEMTMTYEDLPGVGEATVTAEGESDTSVPAVRMTQDMSALLAGAGMPPGFDATIEMVGVGGDFYLRGGPFAAMGVGDDWLHLDFDELAEAGMPGLDMDALLESQPTDPSAQLAQLKAMADIAEVGTEEVRGVATTHYRGVVRLGDAFDQLDEEAQDALAPLYGDDLDAFRDLRVPFEVWIDGDDLVRRMEQTMDLGGLEGADGADLGGTVQMRMEMFDFGADVDIRPPADSTSFLDAIEELAGSLPGAG